MVEDAGPDPTLSEDCFAQNVGHTPKIEFSLYLKHTPREQHSCVGLLMQ